MNSSTKYDPKSSKAEEFINHEEILETLKYAVIIVSSLPMLILYPVLQRYFVKGVMVGSLKG